MRVVVIRRNLAKAVRLVEFYGFRHFRRVGVEPHLCIADQPGFIDQFLYERVSQSVSPGILPDVKTLHFADIAFKLSEGDTAGKLTLIIEQIQPSFRQCIFAGQTN